MRHLFMTVVTAACMVTCLTASETTTSMEKLPRVVRQAVQREAAGAKIRRVVIETENGKTTYEAELLHDGRSRDVSFDADGHVVAVEEETPIDAIPPAAKVAILRAAGSGKVTLVEKVTEGHVVAYEAHVRLGAKTSEVKVDAAGRAVK